MKLVEAISTALTASGTPAALAGWPANWARPGPGQRPGGLIANLLLPYLNYVVRLLVAGHAAREDIDEAAAREFGLRWGRWRCSA